MDVSTIKQRVRLCLDEEAVNLAQIGVGNDDDAYMDNIIADKITDALRWCALYAPDGLLHSDTSSSQTTPEGWRVATEGTFLKSLSNPTVTYTSGATHLTITLPPDFGRLMRVRLGSWKKAVRTPIEEDSDEYLMVNADTAKATTDRPVAALIRTSPNMKLECWPANAADAATLSTGVDITYVCVPEDVTVSSTSVNVPKKMEPAFIYYLAFLVATAYRDSIASSLLQIAKMHLGLS